VGVHRVRGNGSRKLKAKERREQWDQLCQRFDELMKEHSESIGSLCLAAAEFFANEAADQVYQRKPSLAVRLIAEGEPPAKLVISPCWHQSYKRSEKEVSLDRGAVHLELIVERLQSGNKVIPSCEIAFTYRAGAFILTRVSFKWWEESLLSMAKTAKRFLADPSAGYAHSSNNCCICGRTLTDAQSRARGIGPECHAAAIALRQVVERYMQERTPEMAAV
jgi:Family of unknown function (DUF6011)